MKALPRGFSRSQLKTLIRDMVKRLPDANGIVRIYRDSLWEESAVIEYSVKAEYGQVWKESPDSILWTMAFKMWDDLLNAGYKPVRGKAEHVKNNVVHPGNAQPVERCSVARLAALSVRYHKMLLRYPRQKVPVGDLVPGTAVFDNVLYPDVKNHHLWYRTEINGTIKVMQWVEEDSLIEPLRDGSSREPKARKKGNLGVRNRLILDRHGLTKDLRNKLSHLSGKEFAARHAQTLQYAESNLDKKGHGPDWAKNDKIKLTKRRAAWAEVNQTDKKLLGWWRKQKESDRKVINRKLKQEFERLWAGSELVLYPMPKRPFFNTSPEWDIWAQQRLATAPPLKKGQERPIGQHVAWDFRPRPTEAWAWNEAVQLLFDCGYQVTRQTVVVQKMMAAGHNVALARLPVSRENGWTMELLTCVDRYAQQVRSDSVPDPLDTTKVVITYEQFFLYCLSFAKKLHRRNPRRNISDVIYDVAQYLVGSMHFAIYQWSTGDKLDRRPGKLRNEWWRLGMNQQELANHEAELEVPKVIGRMPPRTFENLHGQPKMRVPKNARGEFDEARWTWPFDYENYAAELDARTIPFPHLDDDGKVNGLGYARRFLMMAGATLYELTDELYGKPRALLINKQRHGTNAWLKRKGHDGNGWLAKVGQSINKIRPLDETEITHRFKTVEIPTYDNIPDYNDPTGRRTKRVVRNITVSQVRRGKDGKLEFMDLVESQKARMASAGKDFYSDPEARLQKKEERIILRRIGRVAAGTFTQLEIDAIKHFLRHGEFRRGDHPVNILKKLRDTRVMMGIQL